MTTRDIAAAMLRMETALRHRPEAGLHDDASAIARWEGGTRIVSAHANGTRIASDMPESIGGSGDHVTPGWLFRAGLASCLATCIAMAAAAEGLQLAALEVRAGSRSDTRGMLGIADADGEPVDAGPTDVTLQVRIAAAGVAPDRLRALVERSHRCSPVPSAVRNAIPVELRVDIEAG